MKIKEVKGNTFCIDTGRTYIPFYKINDEEIIMLDSGLAKGERQGIEKLLVDNNFKISAIICTHAHVDHIGNNTYFKNKYNCIIAMPTYEAMLCSSIVNLKGYYSMLTLTEIREQFGDMVCETDIMISHKQSYMEVCGIKFDVFHTPGHSAAHICITTPDEVCYLGDALVSYETMRGAKLPYAYIVSEDLKSKNKLYALKCSKYIVAHKGIYENITELIGANLEFYKAISLKVYEVIEDGMTMDRIRSAVTKNFNLRIDTMARYGLIERLLRPYIEYLSETGSLIFQIEDGLIKYWKS
ncbi:MBL fold metallo-hydrolase [Clostridium folliculivorans]|uniref:MBL fold hydrolase n=1 Tax=Clostridium folliculivorans TaxID=2886038 RepID=A0A9W5Y2I2_9CLOT|nr:MBL fold metallo-hydrolase [Clostridium folliculivorans]GKU25242.1 MBL fold hydrolase [Clostridium folliculivorans]GKU28263.1 MBL fold hydrolase [Clostridium folliculivorans]